MKDVKKKPIDRLELLLNSTGLNQNDILILAAAGAKHGNDLALEVEDMEAFETGMYIFSLISALIEEVTE